MTLTRRSTVVALAIIVITVASCSRTPAGAGERVPVVHTVTMEGTTFQPALVTLRVGDRVMWVNKDFFPHTATAEGVFDSGALASGASWTFVAERPGTHEYICTFHPTMRGSLRVE